MPMLEDAKKIAENVTGWARPSRAESQRPRLRTEGEYISFQGRRNHSQPPEMAARYLSRGSAASEKSRSERLYSKNCSKATGGAISGVTAFTIMCTTIPAFMKCSALPGVKARCNSEDTSVVP